MIAAPADPPARRELAQRAPSASSCEQVEPCSAGGGQGAGAAEPGTTAVRSAGDGSRLAAGGGGGPPRAGSFPPGGWQAPASAMPSSATSCPQEAPRDRKIRATAGQRTARSAGLSRSRRRATGSRRRPRHRRIHRVRTPARTVHDGSRRRTRSPAADSRRRRRLPYGAVVPVPYQKATAQAFPPFRPSSQRLDTPPLEPLHLFCRAPHAEPPSLRRRPEPHHRWCPRRQPTSRRTVRAPSAPRGGGSGHQRPRLDQLRTVADAPRSPGLVTCGRDGHHRRATTSDAAAPDQRRDAAPSWRRSLRRPLPSRTSLPRLRLGARGFL